MEEKIDVAKLLLDCPTAAGMELDCTIYEGVTFIRVDIRDYEFYPIKLKTRSGLDLTLTKYGGYALHVDAKCVIFPKGKNTWEGFQRPFKDGDIISNDICICIYNGKESDKHYGFYVGLGHKNYNKHSSRVPNMLCLLDNYFTKENSRFATEEEKQTLFDAIKSNGYVWNPETNTLEKLVKPNKFNINTLKPFDKVLCRKNDNGIWECDIFSHFNDGELFYKFHCVGVNYKYCIPYEGNEKLLGTTNDCDDFYKTWEENKLWY